MQRLSEALLAVVNALHTSVICAGATDRGRRMLEWMRREPFEKGMLIVEMSTAFRPNSVDQEIRIGLFDRYEIRAVCRHELEKIDLVCVDPECVENRVNERFIWIDQGENNRPRYRRWYNCNFVRIPKNIEEERKMEGR